jgi:hypothetical protein
MMYSFMRSDNNNTIHRYIDMFEEELSARPARREEKRPISLRYPRSEDDS